MPDEDIVDPCATDIVGRAASVHPRLSPQYQIGHDSLSKYFLEALQLVEVPWLQPQKPMPSFGIDHALMRHRPRLDAA